MSKEEKAATPNEDAEKEKGTTATLFPEYAEPEPSPPAEEEKAQSAPTAKAEEKTEEDKPPHTTAPELAPDAEYLMLENFGDKKVKTKVNGVEGEVTLKELIKGYQTDKYLTAKGQRIAEEKKRLDDERTSAQRTGKPSDAPVAAAPEEDEIYREYVKPHIRKYEEDINNLKAELADIKAITMPTRYQHNLETLDKGLKTQGYDDFQKYVPEIESAIMGMSVEEQAEYDTPKGYELLYKDLKLKQVQQEIAKVKKESKKPVDARPEPKIVNIESGGTPSGDVVDMAAYNAAFEKAKKTGDFMEVLRLKGAL